MREERVLARMLKQALSSPGTRPINTLPQKHSEPRQVPLFSQQPSSTHCVDEWAPQMLEGRGGEGGTDVGVGVGIG
ncbi:hypothetical protein NQZ68_010088 [Dissostichus eleginoides]|nr:hypothetical protein NQZ68_010088 [Dissostichus eleginoides]